jgi:hypothetical protein
VLSSGISPNSASAVLVHACRRLNPW